MVGAKMNGGALPFQPHQQPSVGAFDNGDGASTAYSDHSSVHPHSLRANGLGATNNGGTPAASTSGPASRRGAGSTGEAGVASSANTSPRNNGTSAGGVAGSASTPGSHSPPLNRGRYAGTQQSVGAYSNTRTAHPPHHSGGGAPRSPVACSYSSLGHMTGAGGNGGGFDFNGAKLF